MFVPLSYKVYWLAKRSRHIQRWPYLKVQIKKITKPSNLKCKLVPKEYRQKFRKYRRFDNQIYIEFGREKNYLINVRYLVDTFRQLIVIKEFKECVHQDRRTHLGKKEWKISRGSHIYFKYTCTYIRSHKKLFGNSQTDILSELQTRIKKSVS